MKFNSVPFHEKLWFRVKHLSTGIPTILLWLISLPMVACWYFIDHEAGASVMRQMINDLSDMEERASIDRDQLIRKYETK